MSDTFPSEWLRLPRHERIRKARRRAGYRSQEALATAAGVARGTVIAWESPRLQQQPQEEHAETLAQLLGGTPELYIEDGSRQRGEAEIAERMEALADSMEEGMRDVVRLLTEIRNQIAPPSSPEDDDSRGPAQ